MSAVKDNVLDAIQEMCQLDHVIRDTHGNVSMRDGDRFYIKPSGMSYWKIERDDICAVSIDRPKSVEVNIRKPSVDTVHHREIYKKCFWVGAICHTHSPYATAYAALGLDIECYITEHADYFGSKIKCLKYADLDSWGKSVAFNLRLTESAVLLERHGVLTFGKTAMGAVELAVAVENVAQKTYLIENARALASPFDTKEAAKWYERYRNEYGQTDDPDSERS